MTDFIEDLPEFFITGEFAYEITIDGNPAKGIYTPQFEDAFGIETRDHQLAVQESVVLLLGVNHNSVVVIEGKTHRVRGIEPTGTGITMLILENAP